MQKKRDQSGEGVNLKGAFRRAAPPRLTDQEKQDVFQEITKLRTQIIRAAKTQDYEYGLLQKIIDDEANVYKPDLKDKAKKLQKLYESVVNANQGLIYSTLKKYRYHHKYDEMVQNGFLTIIRALDSYDPNIGAFSTYAVSGIKMRTRRFFRPSRNDRNVSLHTENEQGETFVYEDKKAQRPERISIDIENVRIYHDLVAEAITCLTQRERQVLEYRLGLNGCNELKTKEIASVLDLSRQGVKQIERRALGKIQSFLKQRNLDPNEKDRFIKIFGEKAEAGLNNKPTSLSKVDKKRKWQRAKRKKAGAKINAAQTLEL